MDQDALFRAAALRIMVPFIRHALRDLAGLLDTRIQKHIDLFYSIRAFRTASNLDVPTFSDGDVQRNFHNLTRGRFSNVIWYMFTCIVDVFSSMIKVATQLMVLIGVFRGSPEATFLVTISLAQVAVDQVSSS